MFGATFVALATVWSVIVVDAIGESARSDGRSIVVFGSVVGRPGSPAGIWLLIAAVAAAVVLWAMAIGILRGQRLQRRVDAELRQGWREPADLLVTPTVTAASPGSPAASGSPVAPSASPPPRSPRTDPGIAALELRRDRLATELRHVQHELEAARRRAGEADWYGRIEEALIVLPEFEGEDELATRRTTRGEPIEG